MEQKLESLERQMKYYRMVTLLGVIAICVLLFINAVDVQQGDGIQRVVKTQKFELVDRQGKTLLEMQALESAAGIVMYDKSGKEMFFIGGDNQGQGSLIQMRNKEGTNLLQLSSNAKGNAIKLFDDKDKNIIYLGEDRNGDNTGFLNLSANGTQAITLDAIANKIYVANPENRSGYSAFP